MPLKRAQIILQLAQAIGTRLEMPDLLASLNDALKPVLHFDATSIVILEGEAVRVHWAYLDDLRQTAGESVESVVGRYASGMKIEPPPMKMSARDHPISVIVETNRPYIASDLKMETRFESDQPLLNAGFRSYIDLPLLKHGQLIGTIKFLSKETGDYTSAHLELLQDISNVVAIAVSNALAYKEITSLKEQLQIENQVLQEEIAQQSIYEEIVGSSNSLQEVVAAIERVAPTPSTVLITGETGTGKELVAHAIHRRSNRSERALVKVNCAALPAELIASELFGHEKGAFTGAIQQRVGRFEAANGGTIFLDEIAELSPEIQVLLLRVLQEKEFERVGGNRTIKMDVRVIAATNKDLQRAVNEGRFRMDLFYRLNVFPIRVPALRERLNDIPVLVDYFTSRLAARSGKKIRQIEKRSLDLMKQYSWPGNIRELQNVIERCVILAGGEVLRLDAGMLVHETPTCSLPVVNGNGSDRRAAIEAALRATRGRVYGPNGAAAQLGVPGTTLESQIRSMGIKKYLFKQ